ncbi:hypothetical protein TNCV_1543861 [Trichonephila clavipes]|nr:hypothetical protein TNCV_1543861 [Trichonephila clavipes]
MIEKLEFQSAATEHRNDDIIILRHNFHINMIPSTDGVPKSVFESRSFFRVHTVAAVAEWYRHRIVAGVTSSNTTDPRQIYLSRAETSSRWCGVVVRRGGASCSRF